MEDLQRIAATFGAGATFLLLVSVVTVIRGDWVPGYLYRALEKERDGWKALALDGTARLRDAVEVAKK